MCYGVSGHSHSKSTASRRPCSARLDRGGAAPTDTTAQSRALQRAGSGDSSVAAAAAVRQRRRTRLPRRMPAAAATLLSSLPAGCSLRWTAVVPVGAASQPFILAHGGTRNLGSFMETCTLPNDLFFGSGANSLFQYVCFSAVDKLKSMVVLCYSMPLLMAVLPQADD